MCLKVSASNRCGELAGMLKIVSKFAMDILPSVIATIIGAYIVNHYIATKPAADAPPVAAVSNTVSAPSNAVIQPCDSARPWRFARST